jgi:beta-glucanase (GH16 family)
MLRTILVICGVALYLTTTAQYKYKNLVWYDEFNCSTGYADTINWTYDNGDGCPNLCGWGNNEKQFYTNARAENARVVDGKLIVEARKENIQGSGYSSARLVSKGKASWTYGRFEVRAKIPAGKGVWPAIWMLPTDWAYGNWPHSGEIDIMENVGYWSDSLFGSVHTGDYNGMKNTQRTGSIHLNNMSGEYHTYTMEWTPDMIVFYADDKEYHRFNNEKTGSEAWPFDKAFHFVVNIAVGGNWGGKFGIDDSIFPQRMEIDYIRVYQ